MTGSIRVNSAATVLVADDDESLRRVIEFQLQEAGFHVLTAPDGAVALDLFTTNDLACLITDVRMPQLSGLDLLRRAGAIQPETPVIVLTAFGDVDTAVEALRAGAFDYVTKPFNRDQLLATVRKAIQFGRTLAENRALKRMVHERFRIDAIVGESPRMRDMLDVAERVARTDVTVLISGESGTGKELVAKGIHLASSRTEGPFVAINCAAIPESLIESVLFGHKKGSFTGASSDAKGTFEAASGGTLFLDEISSMPVALQLKLLRVLQEQEITRIGENTPRKIDVRIVAATNRNLRTMIEDNSFREDLYFRLAVVPVELPPLRERREDIPLLAEHFLSRACERYGHPGLKIGREVFAALASYSWPGNVRELENTIERMVVLARADVLLPEDLPEAIRQPRESADNVLIDLPPDGISLERIEREIIRKALERHGGNQTRAAQYLDITRSALIYRMQKHGLASAGDDGAAGGAG